MVMVLYGIQILISSWPLQSQSRLIHTVLYHEMNAFIHGTLNDRIMCLISLGTNARFLV
jgi:hypothetical protein